MLKLKMDFNNALSGFLGPLPSGSIATQELDFLYNGRSYHLTALSQGKTLRLALRDEWGEACYGFQVVCMGERLIPAEGEESVDLGERSWLDLASLHLYLDDTSLGKLQIVPEIQTLTPTEKEFAFAQRRAWQSLYQMRTCPPLEVLSDGSEEAARHLSVCASCRALLSDARDNAAWNDLARELASALSPPHVPPVRPGQIWTLQKELEGWDAEGHYLRTPQVLVLSTESGVQVVPVCSEASLADKGDVFLSEDAGFAESWNRFTIPLSSLRECLKTVEGVRLQETLGQSTQGFPEAATDLRRAFEELEAQMAETLEKRALVWKAASSSNVAKKIDFKEWKNTFSQFLRTLFTLPSLGEATVAADDGLTVPLQFLRAPTFQVEQGRASLTDVRSDEKGVHVAGELLLPEGVIPSLLYGWIENSHGDVETIRADMAGLYFALDFHGLMELDERNLRLAAICYGE